MYSVKQKTPKYIGQLRGNDISQVADFSVDSEEKVRL